MSWNKLLTKQITKYLIGDLLNQDAIVHFLNAVDQAYRFYERDRELSDHAYRISEEEYAVLNRRLKEELELKRLGLENLRAAIRRIEGREADPVVDGSEEDNLLFTLSYLGRLMERQQEMEKDLKEPERRL